jgi:hypothetical protein
MGVPHMMTLHYSNFTLKPSSRPKLDNNLEQRENFKAAFDHFDYKKMRNILMIKSLIYCKMLVSYATNLKFIRQLPMHKLPKIQEEFGSFFAIHLGFCKSHLLSTSQET